MAFLAISDIATYLPTGYIPGKVQLILDLVEAELTGDTMVFTAPTVADYQIKPDREGQRVFNLGFYSSITAITKASDLNSSTSLLVTGTDYILVEHPNISGYYIQMELRSPNISNSSLYPPNYININGARGLFIDFTATNNLATKYLKAIVIKWVLKQLQFDSMGNRNLLQSRTSDSHLVWSDINPNFQYYTQILSDPAFTDQLNYFFVL